MVERFHYLKYSLAAVLVFIGSKIFLGDFVFGGKVPAGLSLAVTGVLILSGVAYSLWRSGRRSRTSPHDARSAPFPPAPSSPYAGCAGRIFTHNTDTAAHSIRAPARRITFSGLPPRLLR